MHTHSCTHIHTNVGCTQPEDAHQLFICIHTQPQAKIRDPAGGPSGGRKDSTGGGGGLGHNLPIIQGHSPLESRTLRMKAHRAMTTRRARARKTSRRPQHPRYPWINNRLLGPFCTRTALDPWAWRTESWTLGFVQGNWDSEKLRDLPMVTQPLSGRVEI